MGKIKNELTNETEITFANKKSNQKLYAIDKKHKLMTSYNIH